MVPEAITKAINRPVTAAETRHSLERTIGAAEREEVLALVRWFTRRYPTCDARLAYVRHAYARWKSAAGIGS